MQEGGEGWVRSSNITARAREHGRCSWHYIGITTLWALFQDDGQKSRAPITFFGHLWGCDPSSQLIQREVKGIHIRMLNISLIQPPLVSVWAVSLMLKTPQSVLIFACFLFNPSL